MFHCFITVFHCFIMMVPCSIRTVFCSMTIVTSQSQCPSVQSQCHTVLSQCHTIPKLCSIVHSLSHCLIPMLYFSITILHCLITIANLPSRFSIVPLQCLLSNHNASLSLGNRLPHHLNDYCSTIMSHCHIMMFICTIPVVSCSITFHLLFHLNTPLYYHNVSLSHLNTHYHPYVLLSPQCIFVLSQRFPVPSGCPIIPSQFFSVLSTCCSVSVP